MLGEDDRVLPRAAHAGGVGRGRDLSGERVIRCVRGEREVEGAQLLVRDHGCELEVEGAALRCGRFLPGRGGEQRVGRPHVLAVGDEEARSLGLDVARTRIVIVACATLGTAAAVAVSGLIGFVGIIVPHAIRLVTGVGYRALIPLSMFVGAGFLVLADVVAPTVLAPAELPIGVVTAFVGAPFFIVVLRMRGRR